jgi:transposase-like protein
VVSEVARRADVSSGRVYPWRQEFRAAAAGFAQLLIAPVESSAANGATSCTELAIEIEFAGKVRAGIPGSISSELATAIVKAVSRRGSRFVLGLVWLAVAHTDMRRGMNSLAVQV